MIIVLRDNFILGSHNTTIAIYFIIGSVGGHQSGHSVVPANTYQYIPDHKRRSALCFLPCFHEFCSDASCSAASCSATSCSDALPFRPLLFCYSLFRCPLVSCPLLLCPPTILLPSVPLPPVVVPPCPPPSRPGCESEHRHRAL